MTSLGLLLPGFAPAVATAAEQNGFDSLWLRDGPLHAHTVLCALAALTSTVRLGALVVDVTHRNPAVVAKHATTLDLISHGRAVLGIGTRDAGRLEEALVVARSVFRDERPTFEGRYYRTDGALNQPPPVQPGGPPVLVSGPFDVAARHADAVMLTCGATEIAAALAVLARHCGESGRDPSTLMTLWLPPRSGSPVAMAKAGVAAGIDAIVLDLGHAGPDVVAAVGQAVR